MTSNPPGRVRRTLDDRLLYQVQTHHYFSIVREFEAIKHKIDEACPIQDESNEIIGHISRISADTYRAVIHLHPYTIPARSLDDALSMRQPAAPMLEAEPGQTVLGVC